MEGATSNLFMVKNGTLITHPQGPKILPGVTREVLLRCAKSAGIPFEERAMTLEEAKESQEVFVTSSTRELVWISKWDNVTISKSCGPVTKRLHIEYRKEISRAIP
jgi:D-alanine transaminase